MVNVAKCRLFSQACLGRVLKKKPVSAESTLASDYMRKSFLLCPSQHHLVQALIVKTALAYALIVLP